MRTTSKHLQIQGRSAKLIFILQMPRNKVSLNKHFGRLVFQSRTGSDCKALELRLNDTANIKQIIKGQ